MSLAPAFSRSPPPLLQYLGPPDPAVYQELVFLKRPHRKRIVSPESHPMTSWGRLWTFWAHVDLSRPWSSKQYLWLRGTAESLVGVCASLPPRRKSLSAGTFPVLPETGAPPVPTAGSMSWSLNSKESRHFYRAERWQVSNAMHVVKLTVLWLIKCPQ